MFGVEEPPAKVLTNEEEAADITDASNLSEGSAPDAMEFPDSTELPAGTSLPESMGIAESLSMDGTEMVEERLQDSFESQEPPGSQESQEEWLNEEVLTDDDFNPAAETADSQASQTDNSQSASPLHNETTEPEQIVPEVMEPEQTELVQTEPEQTEPEQTEPEQTEPEQTEPEQMDPEQIEPVQTEPVEMEPEQTEQVKKDHRTTETEVPEQNIEDALNTLEGGPEKDMDLPDLDVFLIRKTNVKTEAETKAEETKQEEDDGNDTDDLLRMLGEDGSKTKKLTKTVKDMRNHAKTEPPSSDDDDFVFEGASAKKLKLAKTLVKRAPLKAEPEDDDATDQSSDEGSTMKKMFKASSSSQKSTKQDIKLVPYKETHVKNIVSVKERPKKDKLATSTPLRASRSILRPPRPAAAAPASLPPRALGKRDTLPLPYTRQKPTVESKTTASATVKTTSILKAAVKQEPKREPEVIDEEELEDIHMIEEEFEEEMMKGRQRIMEPEQMDEDIASDVESHSEDGSLYDELPSSESEDADDWFQVDIRAEKAGDYLPLMGSRAREVLLEEKQRVATRLANLKQSLGALTESGKKQAEQVRTATMALAELDDMLKAS